MKLILHLYESVLVKTIPSVPFSTSLSLSVPSVKMPDVYLLS